MYSFSVLGNLKNNLKVEFQIELKGIRPLKYLLGLLLSCVSCALDEVVGMVPPCRISSWTAFSTFPLSCFNACLAAFTSNPISVSCHEIND